MEGEKFPVARTSTVCSEVFQRGGDASCVLGASSYEGQMEQEGVRALGVRHVKILHLVPAGLRRIGAPVVEMCSFSWYLLVTYFSSSMLPS